MNSTALILIIIGSIFGIMLLACCLAALSIVYCGDCTSEAASNISTDPVDDIVDLNEE